VKHLFPEVLEGDDPDYMGFVQQLESVEANSELYRVYAMDQPEELGGTESYIGDLVLDGNLIASKWGDDILFFEAPAWSWKRV
jgi:hypothetical protein